MSASVQIRQDASASVQLREIAGGGAVHRAGAAVARAGLRRRRVQTGVSATSTMPTASGSRFCTGLELDTGTQLLPAGAGLAAGPLPVGVPPVAFVPPGTTAPMATGDVCDVRDVFGCAG